MQTTDCDEQATRDGTKRTTQLTGQGGWSGAERLQARLATTRFWLEELERAQHYLQVAYPAELPEACWATPNERVELTPSVRLRLFGDPSTSALPVLIVTPQVNHSYIADFSEGQSLVRTLLGCGLPRIAVTDWAEPDSQRAYGIADSIDDLRACLDHLGSPVHLVGLCQGGWQAAILTALSPTRVGSLTVAAAPIDPHRGSTILHAFTLGLPLSYFEGLVAAGRGKVPGALLGAGFDLLKPFERFVYNHVALYLNIGDPGYVRRYQELRNWYRLNQSVAGQLYLEVVRDLFQRNLLARGELEVRGARVDLSQLRCPLYLVAGRRDHITPREQVFALAALAPQAPSRQWTVDAGHIGVFMGRRALSTVWREIGRELAGCRA